MAISKQMQGISTEVEKLKLAEEYARENGADVCLLAALEMAKAKMSLHVAIVLPGKEKQYRLSYGGAVGLATQWASNVSMSLLWRQLLKEDSPQPS